MNYINKGYMYIVDVLPEEQPSRDKTLVSFTRGFVHDVQVGRVEAEGGGRETISDQVDPEQLYGNQRLGQTQSGGQENGYDFTNV